MTFTHTNVCFTLTHECNFACDYCIQGKLQNKSEFLNLKMFKIIVNKIFKSDLKSMDLTLMGGEISTDEKYLDYFQYIFELNKKSNIKLYVNFLTNYSKNDFIKKLINLHKLYPETDLNISITLHKDYCNPKNIIPRLYEIAKEITKTFTVELSFLENFSVFKAEETYYKYYKKDVKYLNKKYGDKFEYNFIQLRNYENCPIDINPGKRRCNALYYEITPEGKIKDMCRNKTFNFMNFKLIKKEIICDSACPCPFLYDEFKQELINE